jgi:hypothetical protein
MSIFQLLRFLILKTIFHVYSYNLHRIDERKLSFQIFKLLNNNDYRLVYNRTTIDR